MRKENITKRAGDEFKWRPRFLMVTLCNNNSTPFDMSNEPFASLALNVNVCTSDIILVAYGAHVNAAT